MKNGSTPSTPPGKPVQPTSMCVADSVQGIREITKQTSCQQCFLMYFPANHRKSGSETGKSMFAADNPLF